MKPALPEHYAILSLTPTCTPTEIKTAYRLRALSLHPDKNPTDPSATARFQKLQEAYEILGYWHSAEHDAERRRMKVEREAKEREATAKKECDRESKKKKKNEGGPKRSSGSSRRTKDEQEINGEYARAYTKEEERIRAYARVYAEEEKKRKEYARAYAQEAEFYELVEEWDKRNGVKGTRGKRVWGDERDYVPANCRGQCGSGRGACGCELGDGRWVWSEGWEWAEGGEKKGVGKKGVPCEGKKTLKGGEKKVDEKKAKKGAEKKGGGKKAMEDNSKTATEPQGPAKFCKD